MKKENKKQIQKLKSEIQELHDESQSGKWIPLSKDTGLLHRCQ